MTLAAIFISYFQSLPASATIRYTSILNNKHIQFI
jgi:hypothetical protein